MSIPEPSLSVMKAFVATQLSSVPPSTFYTVMNISIDCSQKEIKDSYRALARQHHPDKNVAAGDSVDSFVSIKQAFDVLSSALHKKYYDEALAAATTSTSNWVNSKCLKTDEISLVGSVSTRVHIGDLTKEEVEVEEEGEEDGSGNVTSTTTTNCYTHECRCGDVVEILEEELLLKSNVDCIVKECSSCNLTVVVVLQ
ncbi:hypothetical protein ScalyP_jg9041 [Parmales sp. scaly parma]|nr:hypothetical protein ScalyP_jg9041 [Parmales sp. scaly parma]